MYSITDDGRRALSGWLPLDGAPPVLEFELLIKIFFAEHGTKADLLATIGLVRAWTEAQATLGVHITGEYLEGRGPFPERLPWILLTGQFLQDFVNMVERWADRAAETVEPWPEDIRAAPPDLGVLEAMAADNRAILERAEQRRRKSLPAVD